uniref:hypothetical protein n=1 Tax=Paenibacillus sp. FSL R5-0470 TaxID=2921641 RepID=UPI00403FB663
MNWYGYKGNLVVATQSQYILGALLSSGCVNDAKAAILPLKGLQAPSDLQFKLRNDGYRIRVDLRRSSQVESSCHHCIQP